MCDNKERGFYIINDVADYISKWVEIYADVVPYADYRGELTGIFEAIGATVQENSISANSKVAKRIYNGEESEEAPFLLTTLYWQIVLSQNSMEDFMRIWCGTIHGVLRAMGIDYTVKENVPHTLVASTLKATLQELLMIVTDNTGRAIQN